VLRFTYRELLAEPARVMAAILAVIRSGRHRRAVALPRGDTAIAG